MGLGSKIKNALSSDHDQVHKTTTSKTRTPGAFPSEDYLGHSDGYAGDSTTKHTGATGSASGAHSQDYPTSQHKKLHKDTSEVEHNPAYKDDLSPTSVTSQHSRDSGVGGVGSTNIPKDRTSSGNYWGDMGPQSNNNNTTMTNDLPDRSRYSQPGDETLTGRHHHPRVADQVVSGGTSNGTHGTSSHMHQNGPSGVVHDPLTSGTRGAPVASSHGYDEGYLPNHSSSAREEYSDRNMNGKSLNHSGLNGSGLNGSGLNGRGLNGNGLNGSGLNGSGMNGRNSHPTGMIGGGAAAGYGANEPTHQNNYTTDNHPPQHSSPTRGSFGVPKTSMLDPEPAAPTTTTTTGPSQHDAPYGNASGFSSPPMRDGSPQSSSGPGGVTGSSAAPAQAKNHFGPGHEAAKVLHQCEHCGKDNDISRYFRNDVVYRLGS